jgi:hypothetical protein
MTSCRLETKVESLHETSCVSDIPQTLWNIAHETAKWKNSLLNFVYLGARIINWHFIHEEIFEVLADIKILIFVF